MTAEQSNQLQELYDKLINVDDGKRTIMLLGSGSGTNYSISLSQYEGYTEFTIDNFLIEVITVGTSGYANDNVGSFSAACSITKTYDPSTGNFSLTGMSSTWQKNVPAGTASRVNTSIKYNIYLVY